MSIALEIYEAFKDDEKKAHVLASAFERLEGRIPSNVATSEQLDVTRMELQKEIEQLRVEMHEMDGRIQTQLKEMDGRLTKEIAQVRSDMHEMDGRIQTQMAEMDGRIQTQMAEMEGRFNKEIEQLRTEQKTAMARQTGWLTGVMVLQLGAIAAMMQVMTG